MSVDKWIKMSLTHTRAHAYIHEYYSAIKDMNLAIYDNMDDLNGDILSKRSPEDQYHAITGILKTNKTTPEYKEQSGACQWGRGFGG